jgi:hypothetical protein
MNLQLATANVVVLAHHFNPTITDQLWLSKNGIVTDGEMIPPFVFSDMVTHVQTSDFHLLIVPDKCQFTPAPSAKAPQETILARVGALVKMLPHTPYKALGMNFVWHWIPDGVTSEQATRALFFVSERPLHKSFDVPGARFGR